MAKASPPPPMMVTRFPSVFTKIGKAFSVAFCSDMAVLRVVAQSLDRNAAFKKEPGGAGG
ncbi:hypothetical protein GCM10023174_11620 [Chelativorans composti]